MPNGFDLGRVLQRIGTIRQFREQRRASQFPELAGVGSLAEALSLVGPEGLEDPTVRSRVLGRFGATEEQAGPVIGAAGERARRGRLRQFQIAAANIEDEVNDLLGEIDQLEATRAQVPVGDRAGQELINSAIASKRQQIQREAFRLRIAFPDVAGTPEGQALLRRFQAIAALGQIDPSLLRRGGQGPVRGPAPRGIGQPFPPAILEALRGGERGFE